MHRLKSNQWFEEVKDLCSSAVNSIFRTEKKKKDQCNKS